jgi:hypothetical protein
LFGLRKLLSVVVEELEEWRQQEPEELIPGLGVFGDAVEDLRLAKILLVAPEPIPGLDKKCVWGDGPYKVRIDRIE